MNSKLTVNEPIEYRAGDGPLMEIPAGEWEMEAAIDSVVVTWEVDGQPASAALAKADYDLYVSERKIEPKR